VSSNIVVVFVFVLFFVVLSLSMLFLLLLSSPETLCPPVSQAPSPQEQQSLSSLEQLAPVFQGVSQE